MHTSVFSATRLMKALIQVTCPAGFTGNIPAKQSGMTIPSVRRSYEVDLTFPDFNIYREIFTDGQLWGVGLVISLFLSLYFNHAQLRH